MLLDASKKSLRKERKSVKVGAIKFDKKYLTVKPTTEYGNEHQVT